MSDGVNAVLGLIILASGLAFVGGLIGAVFLKGRRKKALGVSGVAFVVFVACVVIAPPLSPEDEAARAEGFRNAEEMSEAESHGISTAEEWDERKQAIEQEQERQEAARKEAEREAEEAAKREADRLAREAEAQAEAEDRRKGFHCLSQWDGAHTEFKRFVKSQMRNPDSFEHIETRVTPVDEDGRHTLMMQYRAENGFGGMNVSSALGTYSNATCDFQLLSLE